MLLRALRAGLSVEAFWAMTPHETVLALIAAAWREQRQREWDARMTWNTAAMVRTKLLPSLKRFLGKDKARPLQGAELAKREAEFAALVRRMGRK